MYYLSTIYQAKNVQKKTKKNWLTVSEKDDLKNK